MSSLKLMGVLTLTLVCISSTHGQMVEQDESEALQMSFDRTADGGAADPAEVAELTVEMTNSFRQAQGLPPVKANPMLKKAAAYFADYMARTDTYGHTADGKRPAERAMNHGYDYCLVAENIAYQYSSAGFSDEELAERFIEVWKNSPRHRSNMLNRDVVHAGVAVAESDKTGYWYAVQMFGRPQSAAIEFTIANRADTTVEYTIDEQSFTLPPRYSRMHMRCRQTTAAFQFPQAEGGVEKIEPKSGDAYAIVRANGKLDVVRQ